MANGWGGRRAGAGRKPAPLVLVALPITDCPLQWLQSAMRCEAMPMRLRIEAAKALLPYCRHESRAS